MTVSVTAARNNNCTEDLHQERRRFSLIRQEKPRITRCGASSHLGPVAPALLIRAVFAIGPSAEMMIYT